MKLVFVGGGTAGSVVPLIAIISEFRKRIPSANMLFIGTRHGVLERSLLRGYGVEYIGIYSGKLRRYFDIKNLLDVVLILVGFFQSLYILIKHKPTIIVGAGGFVSVPVIWAGAILGIRSLIHQQDIVPSLSNKLTAWCASRITVSFEGSMHHFSSRKVIWTGNPCREQILHGNEQNAYKHFHLDKKLPILLVIGGGTGAESINQLIWQSLPELLKECQIIHLSGVGKADRAIKFNGYYQFEFIHDELPDLLAAATIVVSRSGLSAITELSLLGKPTVLIPLPHSHQELNARYCLEQKACIVFNSLSENRQDFIRKIVGLLRDESARNQLVSNIKKIMKPNAAATIASEIQKILRI
ncbi:MAG: UDP-N-acetylglucosamine--N-acetylmuramyl-(pentapeptide) pyrophosphoryl-undecaprenol N-acetylglucosamine transferase [Patescibacteria group bacterium]|nr:UDP-N-acetylglucosamine--N-acetylmuramyl-(pentapeptide) pyrophosphoryl-undecaprenol N-acetylglucosamine transferase [Patescibacteria group bacterium]MDD5715099.1 UDP-N-acetylglucosamine--N-acetylmuramyl-(pentapeptide) pyrophosphoryl-undecaprenol N-acetylglucosamine transferase [Patescibacteria group bacterium]